MFKKFKGIPVSTLLNHMDFEVEIKEIFTKKTKICEHLLTIP